MGRLHERRKKQGERKDIVKESTELVAKFTTSLGSAATAKEIAYSESSILMKTYLKDEAQTVVSLGAACVGVSC